MLYYIFSSASKQFLSRGSLWMTRKLCVWWNVPKKSVLCDELESNLPHVRHSLSKRFISSLILMLEINQKNAQTQTVLMHFNVLYLAERCMKVCGMCIIDFFVYSVDCAQQKGSNGNICSSLMTLRMWLTFEEKYKQLHANQSQPWHIDSFIDKSFQ